MELKNLQSLGLKILIISAIGTITIKILQKYYEKTDSEQNLNNKTKLNEEKTVDLLEREKNYLKIKLNDPNEDPNKNVNVNEDVNEDVNKNVNENENEDLNKNVKEDNTNNHSNNLRFNGLKEIEQITKLLDNRLKDTESSSP